MSRIKKYFIVTLIAVGFFSCAENKHNELDGFAAISFDAWMDKYAPNAQKTSEGYYIEFVRRNPNWENMPILDADSSWLMINYNFSTLLGDVFETRDSLRARYLGTWLPTTHFVDDFISGSSIKLCDGLNYALSTMREGDSARVYIPSNLGFSGSITNNYGYAGATVTYAGKPIYVDVALKKIVNNPYQWEIDSLDKWVAENWGMTKADTITEGLYMRIIKANPQGDTITTDSAVNFNYSNFFLDGQLISTTVESVADSAEYNDGQTSYYYEHYPAAEFTSPTEEFQAIYSHVFPNMRKGEIAEAVAVSWLLDGIEGQLTAVPQILPYESQMYRITVLTDKEVEEIDGGETTEE